MGPLAPNELRLASQLKVAHRSAKREGGPDGKPSEFLRSAKDVHLARSAKVDLRIRHSLPITRRNRSWRFPTSRPSLSRVPSGIGRHVSCFSNRVAFEKRFVYILRNRSTPKRFYTGLTSNVAARLAAHNAGQCTHTADGRPWAIDVVVEFIDETRAVAFERYLKSGSGVAFAMRHLR